MRKQIFTPLWITCLWLGASSLSHGGSPLQERPQNIQQAIDLEVDETEKSFHPKKILILVLDTETGKFSGLGGMIGSHLISEPRVRRLASTMYFDPGAILDDFSEKILLKAAIKRGSATPMQIMELYQAVATEVPPMISRKEARRLRGILEQKVSDHEGMKLARAHGIHVAGSAGHSRLTSETKATACFVGFYPMGKPKHVCLVLVEAARVLPKYNRGALVAAPIFSRITSSEIRLR
jgi:Penicillin binding protein transpeptidase domain